MRRGAILTSLVVATVVAGLSIVLVACGKSEHDHKDNDHDKPGEQHQDEHKEHEHGDEAAMKTVYVCQMSKHTKQYDKPGKCEECEMPLIEKKVPAK